MLKSTQFLCSLRETKFLCSLKSTCFALKVNSQHEKRIQSTTCLDSGSSDRNCMKHPSTPRYRWPLTVTYAEIIETSPLLYPWTRREWRIYWKWYLYKLFNHLIRSPTQEIIMQHCLACNNFVKCVAQDQG